MPQPTAAGPSRISTLAELARGGDVVLVARTARPRTVDDVAFDDYVVEPNALLVGGAVLERGTDKRGRLLAVASVEWPEMPIGWTAMQSRRGDNHLELLDDGDPTGVAPFDRAFVVDTDDTDELRRNFEPKLLAWIAEFDADHGPLTIIFDAVIGADRQRAPDVPAIFVARLIADDDAFIATASHAAAFADHLSAAPPR